MKKLTRTLLLLTTFGLCWTQRAHAQCTTSPNGQYPTVDVALTDNTAPVVFGTNCWTGEYTRCTGTQVGKTYVVTSSVATDYFTVTNGNGNTVQFFGISPLTFTGTTANTRIYRHNNSSCATELVDRTITLTCTGCTPPPPPPANDECAGAISLTSAPGVFSAPGVQSTTNATQSLAGGSDGSCSPASAFAADVWYSFQTDANGGNISITVTPTTGTDIVVQAYSACGTPIAGSCTDAAVTSPSNGAETLTLTGLSLTGEGDPSFLTATYYLRVYRYTSTAAAPAAFSFNITATGTALPLVLKSFTGRTLTSTNQLEWATGEEKNVDIQIVERSFDGAQWSEFGRVAAKGSNSTYQFEDRAPLAKAYYRLRVIDTDGSEQLSNVLILNRRDKGFGITGAFPSPTSDLVTVQFSTPEEERVTLRVTDFTGRLVLEQSFEASKGSNTAALSLVNLPAGTYTVTVSNANTVAEPVRVVKQ